MKILLLVLMCLTSCAQAAPSFKRLGELSYFVHAGKGHCTGTAVARHTLLVADHCVTDTTTTVTIDGKPAAIQAQISDGEDHAFLVLDMSFPKWAQMRQAPLELGEPVYMIGNPADLREILRIGHYAGSDDATFLHPDTGKAVTTKGLFFGYASAGGDSGAAIFDRQGRIVAVNSGSYMVQGLSMAFALPMKFSVAQRRAAGVLRR